MTNIFEKLVRPVLFRLPAETAHNVGMKLLLSGSAAAMAGPVVEHPEFGTIERFGLRFSNPLGIAAGFDKNAIAVEQLCKIGFGSVEVGTVTFDPQPGNPKPRLFRLPLDNALINRLGFNNDGAEKIVERLSRLNRRCVVGVNIGRNKAVANEDALDNYIKTFKAIHSTADYVAVNVSSPNTPGLRDLQTAESLERLLRGLIAAENGHDHKPLLIKIAPDLVDADIEAVVDVAMRLGLAGIIATNTTISRDGLRTQNVERFGAGGLSGRPLFRRSNEVVSLIYRLSGGNLPIIGVGGIFTAQDAFDKIAAGASLLQAYTGFVYGGPRFANNVNSGLAAILKERGYASLDEVVGTAAGRT